MAYELRAVTSPADWQAMHDIRRAELFRPGRHGDDIVYDENHPADRDPANVHVRLEMNGRIVSGQAAEPDTLVASARAYLNAYNRFLMERGAAAQGALAG